MSDRQVLSERASAFIRGDVNDGAFNELALDVFAFQYELLPVVRSLADEAGKTPDTVSRWQDIPAVPTSAFKHLTLFAGNEGDIAQTFESSGTTGTQRSHSHFSTEGLALMDASVHANATRMFLNDDRATRILVLAPSPQMVPSMIMAYGMQKLIDDFGLEGSGFFISPEGFDAKGLLDSMADAATNTIPITLIGASFAFVMLLDQLVDQRIQLPCAPGSRTMDAGGFKDRSRTVTREEMDRMLSERFAIAAHRNVNLLGMTELPSQFYDNVLRDDNADARQKVNPHWTRTSVLDPATLRPLSQGEGILQHLDLANVERPLVIRTEDMGQAHVGGWNVLGRRADADAKGCSLTVADMVQPQPLRKVD